MTTTSYANKLVSFFIDKTGTSWEPSTNLKSQLVDYLAGFEQIAIKSDDELLFHLVELLNERIGLNRNIYRNFVDESAKKGVFFNFHQKVAIETAMNRPRLIAPDSIFQTTKSDLTLLSLLSSMERNRNKEIKNLDSLLVDDDKAEKVIESIFSSFIYYSLPEELVHKKLNPDCNIYYEENYWKHLTRYHNQQINRENSLYIIDLDKISCGITSQEKIRNTLLSLVRECFSTLTNHSYLAVIISEASAEKWSIISDLTIFAEKFLEREINKQYFRWRMVEKHTREYAKDSKINNADFDLGNEGFTFKDCYIAISPENQYSILLFEKNERDEKPIPCPRCRTLNIEGNSYPVIGVRSWECDNIFCGEKSKYNRGKRYSLYSIIRQQAILNDKNIIDRDILKKWRRDIVYIQDKNEITDMLYKFYSLYGDTVIYVGSKHSKPSQIEGRNIIVKGTDDFKININEYSKYQNLHFFKRFMIKKTINNAKDYCNLSDIEQVELYNGDAFNVLSAMPENCIDGAITSPPYYNAKEYSQWKNIYCYLYDMYNIANQTYKCLKDGSPYLFNIFDYFDNEKIIVFSDMGKKRMILSAYISYIFKQIGFRIIGNIPWDKGEIEGKRNFNQGNLSPYYQAPHNCWEHILVFSKGQPTFDINLLPKVLRAKPVLKYINGENTYGHSAPFPKELPILLLKLLKKGSKILDPFSGSMTSGRTAFLNGYSSVNIEQNKEYCRLSLRLLKEDIEAQSQLSFTYRTETTKALS